MNAYLDRLRAWTRHVLVEFRQYKSRLSERAAQVLQPRVGAELRSERPEIHERRRRVHVLVLLAELAALRRFPPHREQPR